MKQNKIGINHGNHLTKKIVVQIIGTGTPTLFLPLPHIWQNGDRFLLN